MLDYNTWRVSQFFCLYAYLCLLIAAVIATISTPSSWVIPSNYPTPKSSPLLPGWGIAFAILGTVVFSILFASISHVHELCDQGNQDRGFDIKITSAASIAVRVPFVAAAVTIAVATATQNRPARSALVAYVILAAIAGFVTLGTLIADLMYLRGLYARTHYTIISNIQPSKIDEDF